VAVVIEVLDYDEQWAATAETSCQELQNGLPGVLTAIEHIGSTSVPGLAAKPIIDLMAAAPALERVLEREKILLGLGYQRHDTGMSGRLFYRRDQQGQRPACHLHIVPADSWATRNERLLRDHLRSHQADVLRYAALKRDLSAHHENPDDYTRAKTQLIQELTDHARAERGLPSVPVWEE
jgi:GrpB-like predicted nucleotidyltransferase (UPF0157 family)